MLFSAEETAPSRFAGISRDEWSAVLDDAARVGLLTGLGIGMYQIHPALPGYLAAGWQAEDPGGYDQQRQACEQALCAACAKFALWLIGQIASGDAALAYALLGWQRRTFSAMLGYALDRSEWVAADRIIRVLDAYWNARGLRTEAGAWADRILDATTDLGQAPAQSANSLWLYTITQQASRQRAAGHVDEAEHAYHRALAYLQDQPVTHWTRSSISAVSHQLGMTAQDRRRLEEAEEWYRKSLAINEELDNRPGMALTYAQLGLLAEEREQAPLALTWNIQSVILIDEFPSPLTGTGPRPRPACPPARHDRTGGRLAGSHRPALATAGPRLRHQPARQGHGSRRLGRTRGSGGRAARVTPIPPRNKESSERKQVYPPPFG
jgi:tetratricopeptide (TPR) repeat protein